MASAPPAPLRGLVRHPACAVAIAAEIATALAPSTQALRRAVVTRPRLRVPVLW